MNQTFKKLGIVLMALVLSFSLVACNSDNRNGSTPESNPSSVEPAAQSVKVTVTCAAAVEEGYGVPGGNAIMLNAVVIELEEGDTVYTTLKKACEAADLSVVETGTGNMLYVQGIGGLSEKDCGSESGWGYTVNGEMPMQGAADCVLENGDEVIWNYFVSYASFQ